MQITLGQLRSLINEADEKSYLEQTFSDASGEYRVLDIIAWAKANASMASFNVDDLAKIAFEASPDESYDEVPGSPEFVARSMRSDLSYPIVVIRYPDGDYIADGNHRLWKAREEGHRTIKGYLMFPKDLEQLPQV